MTWIYLKEPKMEIFIVKDLDILSKIVKVKGMLNRTRMRHNLKIKEIFHSSTWAIIIQRPRIDMIILLNKIMLKNVGQPSQQVK